MPWLAVQCRVPADEVERFADLLFELGAAAVELAPGVEGADVLEPAPGTTPLWADNRVCGLFGLDAELAPVRATLAGRPGLEVRFVEDDDWSQVWRRHAQPYVAGPTLMIAPDGHGPAPDFRGIVVHLDPGLAFGSGSHPSTRLCLDWLAGAALTGRALLDYGCGSGILAIAARRLGADVVVAIDHDPQALVATRANAQYNDAPIDFIGLPGELGAAAPFDIVMANILANPLIELAPALTARLRVGGTLVLAGVLEDQALAIVRAYVGVGFEPAVARDGWVRLTGVREG